MRLLVVTNLFPPFVLGGYEILCGQVCEELRRRGHDVHVIASDHGVTGRDGDPTWVRRTMRLYHAFGSPAGMERGARAQASRHNDRAMRVALAEVRPDVVFVWSQLRLTLGAARAAEESGIPTAYTLNDEHLTGYLPGRPGWGLRDVARFLADRFVFPDLTLRGLALRHVTCISQCLKDRLVAAGVAVGHATVIHQGIPVSEFPCKPRPGAIGSPLRLLYVGQLHEYKGVHTLLEAADRVARLLGTVRVTVVGDGPADYVGRLRTLAAAGRADVDFAGRLPHADLPSVYRTHDVFVFPSIWAEPFGLTHLEAMASGTVVVSTADGGQAEFLEDDRNALVFPKKDAKELASRILALAADPALAERLAVSARSLVERRYSIERYVSDLERFLRGCLPEGREVPG